MVPSTSNAQPAQHESEPRKRISLAMQAALLFVAVALGPVVFVSLWLTGLYRSAIETSEKQLQMSALAELATQALRGVTDVQADAEAVAGAISQAVAQPGEQAIALGAVRSLLATRRSIQAVRLEVPLAHVSTVLRQVAADASEIPGSTVEQRATADERGVAYAVTSSNRGLVVVPIPTTSPQAARGYVTAQADLAPLVAALRQVAQTRFNANNVQIVVADGQRRLVASYGVNSMASGDDVSRLPIWNIMPAGTPWTTRVGVVSEHVQNGVAMVGAVQTVPQIGWTLAIWRPRDIAYQNLWTLTNRFRIAAGFSVLIALAIGLLASGRIVRPIRILSAQARLIGQRRWREVTINDDRSDEIGDLSRSLKTMAHSLERGEAQLKEEAQLRADLSRFMDRELVEAIVRGDHSLELGGHHTEITVLFADVVAFTSLAESQPPERTVAILNELFAMLSEIVFRHHGTVDKFIGDCIMAVWGAPVRQVDHGQRALAAATEMLRFLEVANENWAKTYEVQLRLAIGVNSGSVIVGNIGSKKRMEYTVVGDVVNVASRLESLAQPNQILVGEATHALANGAFTFRPRGEHKLTGRESSTTVYELIP